MKQPSGLRRSVISATFTATAVLVVVLWALEDQVVDDRVDGAQQATLQLALDDYLEATEATGADAAIADRIGALHGCRIEERRETPSPPNVPPPSDTFVASPSPIGHTNVLLVSHLPDGRVVEVRDVQRLRYLVHTSVRALVLVGGLVAVIVGVFLTWGLTHTLVAPARELTKVADALAAGHLEARARSDRDDELGLIGRSLDRLAEQLVEREERLRAQEDRLTTMLDSMVEGVFVTDDDGTIDLTNDALDALIEVDPIGRTIIEVIRDADLHDAVMYAIGSGEWSAAREVSFSHMLGNELRHFVAQVSPLEHGGGVIGVVHDVTRLVAADGVRRDFIANASHELRTPVTAIRGYAETLASGAARDPARAGRFIDVILRHASRLEALVDDMVTLSRAESEMSEIALEPVSLTAVVDEVVEGLSGHAEAKSIAVTSAGLDDLPLALAHPRGADQVLINLVDNAIKYTPERGRVRIEGTSDGDRVSVSVSNTGPGISSKHLDRIFERFYRVDAGRSREIGGTGLGLAIVKHLVATMGGAITVSSQTDDTRFTVSFPIAPAASTLESALHGAPDDQSSGTG